MARHAAPRTLQPGDLLVRAGALLFLQPVSGLVLASLLLGDRPTPSFLLGCALVLAGVYLAVMMIINSVVSLVYYFSIIKAMFFQPVAEPVRPVRPPILVMAVVVVAAATVLAVGVYPPLFAHFPHLSTLIGR